MWEIGSDGASQHNKGTLNQKLAKKWDLKFDFQIKKEKEIEEKQGQFLDRLTNGEILKEEPRDNNLFMKTTNFYIEASSKLTNKKFKQGTIQKFNKLEALSRVKLSQITGSSKKVSYH